MKEPPKLTARSIRIPKDLIDHLQREADKNKRSLNAEIWFRLEQSSISDAENLPRIGSANARPR
ncbi:Arc family DNA-binding protein [Curvibacter sp. HBC61]|uniref:Arc family DNA-binding protein n=1 Tax=Curvibacter cyanobacteriorum TaxID=3026422 RepID=A0ABT5MX56_9BURK|nr:Arc family DNA-binding protein [Curvibacter sp. HBC61]MDD0837876.1 Arc family DNA-binding protein [Curvibacter sp. HBC61]